MKFRRTCRGLALAQKVDDLLCALNVLLYWEHFVEVDRWNAVYRERQLVLIVRVED